ncbi:cyclophilin-like fold protein [Ancylobacter sp. VNQ12]|uniref:cyclophilin-like fold protein n=1 Tax=Ancylobacter sp. VNQ12 TaxID=3400920 RepID=UPI003C058C13
MQIRISTEAQAAVVELDDNAATRGFLALLPLKLVLGDRSATEKIADLPGKPPPRGARPV